MKPKKLILLVCLLIIPFMFTACTKKLSEKAAERAVEQASDGKVKVDINGKETTVKTEAGTGKVGENVSLPADWPKDIYVIDGRITTAYMNTGASGWTVLIETPKTMAEAKSLYDAKLKESGWKIASLLDMGATVAISGTKDKRTVSVIIGTNTDTGKTSVMVGAAEK